MDGLSSLGKVWGADAPFAGEPHALPADTEMG
jgi:hypothetical protein